MKKTELKWQKVKLLDNGAKGLHSEWAELWEHKGKGFLKSQKLDFDIPPHNDLIKALKGLKPIVAKVESFDYARNLLNTKGFEPSDIQIKMTEEMVQQFMEKIEITGVSISEKRSEMGAIISYKKYDEQGKVSRHSTSWIGTEIIVYDVEEELKEILDGIEIEANEYWFNEKCADFEQLSIPDPDDDSEED